jgi:D-alanyl-D-alanine carboxypeptidase (penicillin-binding protein 5/6)
VKLRLVALAAVLLVASPALASPPRVGGRAYLVENSATGEVLAIRNPRERLPIASITKLMTVLVALEHARPDDVVIVSARAADVGESTVDLTAGEQLTVRELVEAALVPSANDAATALAEYVSRSDLKAFVALMNAKAQELGLTDTHFMNVDGLDTVGHYSSARDVTALALAAMRNPLVRETVRRRNVTVGGHTFSSRNDLLSSFPHVFGVKTGHTSAAGWSEVAAVRGRGLTIYATLLGEPTQAARDADLSALLAWGLARYRVVPAINAERIYAKVRMGYGRKPIALVAPRSLLRVVRLDRTLLEQVVAPPVASLPVREGQRLGEVRIFSRGKLLASSPLVATRSVSRPDFFGRVGWYAGRTVHHFASWF